MNTDSYLKRVAGNLLPLSVAQDVKEAFAEWAFTENTHDNEDATEQCELCDHEDLRYQFEIANKHNDNTLWVGSQCILRFDVAVYDGGVRLDDKAARKKLNALTEDMRYRSCIKALERLAAADSNPILSNALKYFKEKECLSPKFAFVVLWRLKEEGIDHSPSFFKVSLSRHKYRDDLRKMERSRVHMIWPAMTSSQRRLAQQMGHMPPSP